MEKPQLNKGKSSTYSGGLPQNIITLLNKQIEVEAFSSQIYLQMAAWADPKGYLGAASFFRKHAEEERKHMLKLYEFLSDKNVVAITPPLASPQTEYIDLYDAIETAKEHEYYVTSTYEKACEAALNEPCHQAFELFQYFIHEQVEEESLYTSICDRYNLIKKYGVTGAAILEFDKWLESLA